MPFNRPYEIYICASVFDNFNVIYYLSDIPFRIRRGTWCVRLEFLVFNIAFETFEMFFFSIGSNLDALFDKLRSFKGR